MIYTYILIGLMTTIGIGCTQNQFSVSVRGPTVIEKREEPERYFYKEKLDNSGTNVVIKAEPWVDGKDFILVVNDEDNIFEVFTNEQVFKVTGIEDTVDLSNTEIYKLVDTNNKKL